jgi:hypothetical protein
MKPKVEIVRQGSVQYPEHQKMKAVKEQSQTIGEFLDWLFSKGTVLAHYQGRLDELMPRNMNIENLLATYFEIDLDKIEEEKQQMIDELTNTKERSGNK